MRRLLVILLVSLALPAAAVAAMPHDRGDGTLAIRNASATIVVRARGTVLGRVAEGTLRIVDLNPLDANTPQVVGADRPVQQKGDAVVYRGTAMRFRFVGGSYVIAITGTGIDLAAVGQGTVRMIGLGTPDDGQFSTDGAPYLDVPPTLYKDVFGQAATATTAG